MDILLAKDDFLLTTDGEVSHKKISVLDAYSKIKNSEDIEIICYSSEKNALVTRDIKDIVKDGKHTLLEIETEGNNVLIEPMNELKTNEGFMQARYLTPYTELVNVTTNQLIPIKGINSNITEQMFKISVNSSGSPVVNNLVIR